jgi:hypothetical protein
MILDFVDNFTGGLTSEMISNSESSIDSSVFVMFRKFTRSSDLSQTYSLSFPGNATE